jgi:hypothetical protein
MQRIIAFVSMILLFTPSATPAEDDSMKVTPTDVPRTETEVRPAQDPVDRVVVYYLHSNRRCKSCKKLEAYSEEAVTSGFESQLEDSLIIWQVVNFEEEDNEHYVEDYGLYTQALVLSRLQGDKEVEWRNLEKIWKLLGNKKEFIAYVQGELSAFLSPAKEQDE